MNFLSDIIAQNMSDKINKDIKDYKENGFFVMVHNGKMTIESNVHPWRKNAKTRQNNDIKRLQKKIGGEFSTFLDKPRLTFDVSSIKSARCIRNPSIFGFSEYIEVICKENEDGTIIVPKGLLSIFEKEFKSLSFVETNDDWEFIEYTGQYPALCGGDTVFKSGETTINTKIINHHSSKWKVEIPKLLKNIKMPDELFLRDNMPTSCCGGCD